MVQIIGPSPRAMQWGQLGENIGQGLSARMGLADAEKALQNAGGDPFKLASAFARLNLAAPGLERSLGQMYQAALAQAQGQAMGEKDQPKAPNFPYPVTENISTDEVAPSISKSTDIKKRIDGFIPPSQQQIVNEAGQLYRENPMMFGNDPNKAIEYVTQKYGQEEKIAQAYKDRYEDLKGVERSVVSALREQSNDLGVKDLIPAKTHSEIEKKAIADVNDGMTEEQVRRKYGDQLDEIARQYKKINSIGKYGLLTNNKESIASLKSLQKQFKERGPEEVRNFAHTISAENNVSLPTAYAFADPISDHPKINSYMSNLKINTASSPEMYQSNTEKIVPKLAKLIKEENVSPQTVFYYMQKKGYDPVVLKSYLDENRYDLNLTAYQQDQLGEEISPTIRSMSDTWLDIWGGLK